MMQFCILCQFWTHILIYVCRKRSMYSVMGIKNVKVNVKYSPANIFRAKSQRNRPSSFMFCYIMFAFCVKLLMI